jgi:hypothetical protein
MILVTTLSNSLPCETYGDLSYSRAHMYRKSMVIVKSGVTGRWGVKRGIDGDLAQLAAATEEERGALSLEKLNGGEGGTGLACHSCQSQITMEIHISDWTYKFQNKTGLDAKANSELYKSNRVNSVLTLLTFIFLTTFVHNETDAFDTNVFHT